MLIGELTDDDDIRGMQIAEEAIALYRHQKAKQAAEDLIAQRRTQRAANIGAYQTQTALAAGPLPATTQQSGAASATCTNTIPIAAYRNRASGSSQQDEADFDIFEDSRNNEDEADMSALPDDGTQSNKRKVRADEDNEQSTGLGAAESTRPAAKKIKIPGPTTLANGPLNRLNMDKENEEVIPEGSEDVED